MCDIFKSKLSLEERKEQSKEIMRRYPDRVPVYVSKSQNSKYDDISKHKFIVPKDITFSQFMHVIRKHIPSLTPEQAIFVFVHKVLPRSSELISSIYEKHKDEDGFLYIEFSHESVFG